jgi:dTDP-4-dehydrorhamnose reductase
MRIKKNIKVLVLGANGMLGNAVFRLFAASSGYQVFGTVRSSLALKLLPSYLHPYVLAGVDVESSDSLTRIFSEVQPDVVINCVGLVKQLQAGGDPFAAISINAMLPHRLAKLCAGAGARLVQMGTDCIFSGKKGFYNEADVSDATDLYGRSKYLGEVDYPHAITLRTSIIGHELDGAHSLIGWFLAQTGRIKGYRRAVFSGLPTVEMARVIRDYVIPHPELHGVYHVSVAPINKFDLLRLVAQVYGKAIDICADDQLVIDRSLDSTRFQQATGYVAPEWPELINLMYSYK